jgi:hypothetical protein
MNTVFIFTDTQQRIGATVAKFALEKHRRDPAAFAVEIIEVERYPLFRAFVGKEYIFGRDRSRRTYSLGDLQSFTLTRFMPPELMHYQGRAIGIDPDIFALADVSELFTLDLKGHAIAACTKKDAWDSSVMLMDCAKLAHWDIASILDGLAAGKTVYMRLMTLEGEQVIEIPRTWNSLDALSADTKMLHTTTRLTQPWKTGLPIDFTRNAMPKYFGLIPREPIHKLFGTYDTHYQPHPDKNIERFFFDLLTEAIGAGAVTADELDSAIAAGDIRRDAHAMLG